MTIYVVRHAEARLNKLTEKGVEASKEKWNDIWIMLEGIKDEVLILTSPENRAIETAENIRIWLKDESIEIKELDSLSDADVWWEMKVFMDILKLPQYPVLVLVTHANYMYEVAKALGYNRWPFPHEPHLEDYEISPEEYEPVFKIYRV